MSKVKITAEELSLVKQNNQRRYVKLQVINRDWHSVGVIQGRLISGNVSIDGESTISRTASISMETEEDYLRIPAADICIDLQRDMPANYYIRLWLGIEDNNTLRVYWYSQGIFIINESSYTYDPTTRTLNVSLVDLMYDLNGERSGELHAYTSIVKNEQRIDTVMKNVLDIIGIPMYEIEPITVLRDINTPIDKDESETDYMIPYDLNFSVGVTAYEILEKMVTLYPYYRMGFDSNGVFICEKEQLEQDDSYVLLDAVSISDLIISEDCTINHSEWKNHIEVWGKDGLYYGEADDTNPESPFQISAVPLRRFVVKNNEYGVNTDNICDRYYDDEKASELQKNQASLEANIAKLEKIENPTVEQQRQLSDYKNQLNNNKSEQKWNVRISGNELARQWAKRILYDKTRIVDNITIKTVMMPFINETDFKISYRSRFDNVIRPYVVKSVSHDFASGTSTINMIRFYDGMCVNYWEQLDKPVISSAVGIGMDVVVTIANVEHAETYVLYIDGNKVGTYTSTTMIYQIPDVMQGVHTVFVTAEAPYYRTSEASNSATVTVEPITDDYLITDANDYLITDSEEAIILDDEEE